MFKKTIFDLKDRLASPRPFISWFSASLLTGIAGPFGMYEVYPLWQRLIYWGGVLGVSTIFALFIFTLIRNQNPERSFVKSSLISIPLFTIPYGAFILCINQWIIIGQNQPPAIIVFSTVAVATTAIFTIMYWIELKTQERLEKLSLTHLYNTKSNNPLLSRLDLDIGERLIRLTMRDHYVEAFTNNGMQLIHMRFSDAVKALIDFNGMQVHRSHWVNFDEATDIFRKDGKARIIMSDSVEVPISRSKYDDLKRLGVFEDR